MAMLRLPLTATLLATLLLGTNGVNVMPLVIVAVLVSYVLTARLTPVAKPAIAPGRAVVELAQGASTLTTNETAFAIAGDISGAHGLLGGKCLPGCTTRRHTPRFPRHQTVGCGRPLF